MTLSWLVDDGVSAIYEVLNLYALINKHEYPTWGSVAFGCVKKHPHKVSFFANCHCLATAAVIYTHTLLCTYSANASCAFYMYVHRVRYFWFLCAIACVCECACYALRRSITYV